MHLTGTIFLAKRTAFFSVEKVLSATFIGRDKVCNNRILLSLVILLLIIIAIALFYELSVLSMSSAFSLSLSSGESTITLVLSELLLELRAEKLA